MPPVALPKPGSHRLNVCQHSAAVATIKAAALKAPRLWPLALAFTTSQRLSKRQSDLGELSRSLLVLPGVA
jgi:hypothetical protein